MNVTKSVLCKQAEIEEQRFQMKRTSRTTEEKCKLYTVRFLINFLIVIMLGGAGAAIYFAQDFSTSVSLMNVVSMENYVLLPDG